MHVLLRYEKHQLIKLINLHQEINRIVLLIVLHETWYNLGNQFKQIITAHLLLNSVLVLFPDIGRKPTQVLMAPIFEFREGAFLQVP
jgi:hypothetical protein